MSADRPTPPRTTAERKRLAVGVLAAIALSGTLALSSCAAPAPIPVEAKISAKLTEATGSAFVSGSAIGPAGLVGGNLVSNNGGNIISNNGSGIIAGNSSRYRLAAAPVKQEPIANAIVYLTDPEDRFFATKGKPLTATTDARGKYTFTNGLPAGQVIIVNVMLADNRREVGYSISRNGGNVIDVSLASTYVTEFLRMRAAKVGKKMGDYDLAALQKLTELTNKALAAGELDVPDLSIGKIAEMNHVYGLAVGLNKQGLGDAWAQVLGERILAITTVAGTGEAGNDGDGALATKAMFLKAIGLARDTKGNIYVIDEGNHNVRRIDAETGVITTIAGTGSASDGGDGGPAAKAALNWPRTGVVGPDGALYVSDAQNNRIRQIDLASGIIQSIAGDPVMAGGQGVDDFAGDGGPATKAKLAAARGLAFDSKGNLIFSDSWAAGGQSWDHIRQIAPDGTISSLVGVDNVRGYNGEDTLGRETQVSYLNGVAVDSEDKVYFADTNNHRIRCYDPKTQRVKTVVGTGVEAKDGGVVEGALATATPISFPLGLAIDAKGRLFFSERGTRRVRVVLEDGTVRTLAGGGKFTADGESTALALTEPVDLLLEPNGNLLIADSRAAKVRRLWLQWGL